MIAFSENSSKKRIIISLVLILLLVFIILISTVSEKKESYSSTRSTTQTSSPLLLILQTTTTTTLKPLLEKKHTQSNAQTSLSSPLLSLLEYPTMTTILQPFFGIKHTQSNSQTSSSSPLLLLLQNQTTTTTTTTLQPFVENHYSQTSSFSPLFHHFENVQTNKYLKEEEKREKVKSSFTCKPRNLFISWSMVRAYIVYNIGESIPGTWIGMPLMVKKCHECLDPCGYKSYCSTYEEENVTREMKIVDDNQENISNITLYFVQDKVCHCVINKPIRDDFCTVPYIYNVTVDRE